MFKPKNDLLPAPPTSLSKNIALPKLERDVGLIGNLVARSKTRTDRTDALVAVKREQAQALGRLGVASTRIAESNLMGNLVNQALGSVAALTAENHHRTGAAIASITATMGAERIAHVNNRTAQHQALAARQARKELTEEEVAALRSYADADLAADIDAANRRGERSKEAVENLSSYALTGLRIPFATPGDDA